MISNVIALTAYQIVIKQLSQGNLGDHKCFRIKNFTNEEVLKFVEIWGKDLRPTELKNVSLVVAENINNKIDKLYLAEPKKSITYYRNNNPFGLVYLETRVQSDEQGLQNIFTLQDRNFLDGSFDFRGEYDDFIVAEALVNNCWMILGCEGVAPQLLRSRILEILGYLDDLAVRRFTKFVLKALQSYLASGGALSEDQINEMVGCDLTALDFFPDQYIFSDEKKAKKRLLQNRNYADLDSGSGDIIPEILLPKVLTFDFKDILGAPLSRDQNQLYRDLCSSFISTQSFDSRAQIPFDVFEQLFTVDMSGLLLGDRVLNEISVVDNSRTKELLAANIIDGLNKRLEDEARRFIELDPPEGLEPLMFLLNRPTKKLIEQLANPRAQQFFNPILEFVEAIDLLREGVNEGEAHALNLRLAGKANKDNLSIRLFAFIFGETLRSAEEKCIADGFSIGLKVDPELIRFVEAPLFSEIEVSDEEVETSTFIWEPIPLIFDLIDSSGNVVNSIGKKEWFPSKDNLDYLAFLWLLICAPESNYSNISSGLSLPEDRALNNVIADFASRTLPISLVVADTKSQEPNFSSKFIPIRKEFFSKLRLKGLDSDLIDEYLDEWMSIFEESRTALVPDGARLPAVTELMDMDFINFGGRTKLMLPTHPIRLRWISRYLSECEKLVGAVLSGEKELSKRNPGFYLDWLRNLSPNQAPAISSNKFGEILFSSGEQAWYEEFTPRNNEIAGVTLDAHSTKRIARQITSYLEAHPYKKDGLSILLVAPYANKFPAELINTFRALDWKDTKVDLTVISKRSTWPEISKFFDSLHNEDRMTSGSSLFPSCELSFIDYADNFSLSKSLADLKFDLAIVTHLLNEKVTVQNNTEAPVSFGGTFRPLMDRPTHLKGGVSGGAISILMRPDEPDVMLETWSTHVVRSQRLRPIAPAQPENTDFLELRVNFEESAKLFTELHTLCHWVITLERHISRQQIEALEVSPDILSVEEGVGSSNNFTLIVSASSGKELIISRLTRKLDRLITDKSALISCGTTLEEVSRLIYNETRRFAPKLALKAMGVSRVTEEVIGLMVARSLSGLEKTRKSSVNRNLFASISLDEHQNWFGGPTEVRADIANFLFELDGDRLILDIEVIEGKLRQVYDVHGILQVSETIKFLQDILVNVGRIDSSLWREQIISAIETADFSMIKLSGFEAESEFQAIPPNIREKFRSGEFTLRSIKGLYSICLWDDTGKDISRDFQGDIQIVRSCSSNIIPLILDRMNKAPINIDSNRNSLHVDAKVAVSESPDNLPYVNTSSAVNVNQAPVKEPKSPLREMAKQKLTSEQLRDLYQVILDCYSEQGIDVMPALADDIPFVEGPASILFKVMPKGATDPKKLMDKSQVLKLKLRLEQDQEIMFSIDKGYVNIDVPKLSAQRYFVDASDMWSRWKRPELVLEAPLGEDRYGEVVSINFSDTLSPHILVGGTTGSGKSEALNVLLYGLIRSYSPAELRLLLVDPKGTELQDFARAPHLLGEIGWGDTEALELLKHAVIEMQSRYEKMREEKTRTIAEFNSKVSPDRRMPWWVVVLDEYADLTSEPSMKKEIEAELKRLAQKARAAGIHVVIATQKPSVEVISTVLRSNLPAQLALRVKSATESRVIMDESGAEMLNGKGDSYLKLGSASIRVQCALVSKTDSELILGNFN